MSPTLITPYSAAWLHPEQWRDVTAPLSFGSGHRTPELLDQVLDQFVVELAERYQPKPGVTQCNRFACDFTAAAGCPLPRVVLKGDRWLELSANLLWEWLTGECLTLPRLYRHASAQAGWAAADRAGAVKAAARGAIAVPVSRNPNGSGHIAVMRSSGSICQAGGHNYTSCSVELGFGSFTSAARWFIHP